jgi:ribosomal subunit interface protein
MNETNTATLPIHITPHHLRLSPAIIEFVRTKFAKVPRIATDALATEVVLRRHHGTSGGRLFSASARVAVAGQDIHATATHPDLYTAVVKLVSRLARGSRKRKARLEKARTLRREMPRRTPEHPSSPPEMPPFDDAGQETVEIQNSRRRAGGQEQRVFAFRRKEPFTLHQF